MSYVAEPYVQFVDDLLNALTGGETRLRFVYLPKGDYPLASPDPVIPDTIRVFGQALGRFRLFTVKRDYDFIDGAIVWRLGADAIPDEGTAFYVNFEAQRPPGSLPPLTDRHQGSVTRLLAESFAREYAVLSGQLEGIYRSGFLATAGGRDLDELVKLVGITRRSGAFAVGTAVFSRLSPAPADIQIEAGTRLSTVQPPEVSFVTTEDRTLRRGELSVEAPLAATVPGTPGVVPAKAVSAIDRPLLGVDRVENSQATRLIGDDESDEALRRRGERAHEGAGKATTGALLAALTSIPGLREKDVRIDEDHLLFPGVLKLGIVLPATKSLNAEESATLERRIAEQIEATRPVGVHVLYRLDRAEARLNAQPLPALGVALPKLPAPLSSDGNLLAIRVAVTVIPATTSLRLAERTGLKQRVGRVIDAYFDELGIGEPVVYHRLIADLMGVEGVLDVAVDLAAENDTQVYRANVYPASSGLRPVLGSLKVEIAGQLIRLSVSVAIELTGAGGLGDQTAAMKDALDSVAERLEEGLRLFGADTVVTNKVLQGLVASTSGPFTAKVVSHRAEYVDAGVNILIPNPAIPIAVGETMVLGQVSLEPS